MSHSIRTRALPAATTVVVALTILIGTILAGAGPALAHGFTSVVYVDATSPGPGQVRTELGLEYDLLVVSAADSEKDDPLFQEGTAAFESHDAEEQAAVLDAHAATVMRYVTGRFGVSAAGAACTPVQDGGVTIKTRDDVPYAYLILDYQCSDVAEHHEVTSRLFSGSEGYVKSTKTIVTYQLDGTSGSAALDAKHASFSTLQTGAERFWEFFRLGAEHLIGGIDHILFLLALIAGSRRLREVVLAATSFTVAHSVTFVLAALGVVHVPARIVEPIIALSIAAVAGWYLWRLWQRGSHATDLDTTGHGHFSLDRAGWTRLGVVFAFGLVHGLGFAGALGIDEAWSWTLLWSLLVFNVGIEVVQLAIIAVVFPLLAIQRRQTPIAGRWTTGAVAMGVSLMGLVWFAQRAFEL